MSDGRKESCKDLDELCLCRCAGPIEAAGDTSETVPDALGGNGLGLDRTGDLDEES